MIPYILIIVGIITAICGLIGLIKLILLPLVRAHKVVFERKDDYLFYENELGQRVLKSQIRFLCNIYISLLLTGALLIFSGFYLGFTEHGTDFWFYKILYSNNEEYSHDRITKDGQYIALDGKKYNYYILIRGADIYFKEDKCKDNSALEEHIKGFDRTNTIVIYDDFAVSSEYHFVLDLLKKSGIHYIEEGN